MRVYRSASHLILALSLIVGTTANPAYCKKETPWDTSMAAGEQAMHAGDYDQARTQFEEALKQSAKFQTDDPRLGRTYYNLGEIYLRQQDYPNAKSFFERALPAQQKAFGFDSIEVGDTLYGLGTCAEQVGDHELAVALLKKVKEIWTAKYGANSKKVSSILAPLATYAALDSDYQLTQQCYKQLVGIQEATLGGDNPEVGMSLNMLAGVLARTGHFAEAEPHAERAVDLLSKSPDYRTPLDAAIMSLAYIRQQLHKPAPNVVAQAYSPPSGNQEIAVRVSGKVEDASSKPAEPVFKAPEFKTVAPASKIGTTPPEPVSKPASAKLPEPPLTPASVKPAEPVSTPASVKVKEPESKPVAPVSSPAATASPSSNKTQIAVKLSAQKEGDAASATVNAPAETPVKPKESVSTQQVMRTPAAKVETSSADEFRPWELKDGARHSSSGSKVSVANANWGKVSYLANGRLISPEEYQALLLANQAYDLIRSEKYSMAVEVLKKALGIYPDLASGHTNLGLALCQIGQIDEAIDHLRESIAIEPAHPAPWLNLASSFQSNGKLPEAVATYSEYVRRFPSDPMSTKARDIVAQLQKEVDAEKIVAQSSGGHSTTDYFAYASQGGAVRWPAERTSIKVYIASADGVPGFKSEYGGFFTDSFRQWSAASQNKIAFDFVKRPDGADISCAFTNDVSRVSSPAEGGETKVEFAGKNIQHSTITVLTVGPSPDSPLSANQVKAVCLHEIGHALGLVGHSPKPVDIMYCSMPPANGKVALSSRDTATIIKLYSSEVAGVRLRPDMTGMIPQRDSSNRS
jgi:tetratricopeptide (TPR) repeat protein